MSASRTATLLRVATLQEDAGRAQVTRASQVVDAEQTRLDAALDALSSEAHAGGTVGELRASNERLCRLAQAVGQQQAVLEQARTALTEHTRTWQERRQHRHLMQEWHDRHVAALTAAELARTQRLVDDLSSAASARRPAGAAS